MGKEFGPITTKASNKSKTTQPQTESEQADAEEPIAAAPEPTTKGSITGVAPKRKNKNRSYAWRPADQDRIAELKKRFKERDYTVNETDILRGLLVLGEKTSVTDLFKAIHEANLGLLK